MPASRFTPENRASLIQRFEAGATMPDAARALGLRAATVREWLRRGKREDEGPYADFAVAFEAARQRRDEQPPMSRAEFQQHLDRAVRSGSVAAMKLWAEIDREKRQPVQPKTGSKIADLAERRRAQGAR
jgi:IS30 family transposase